MRKLATEDADRIGKPAHSFLTTVLLALASCVSFVAAFPPYDIWPAIVLPPALLAWLAIHACSTVRAVIVTYVTHAIMWLWLQRWMVDVSEVGYPALCLYLALYSAVFVWIVRRVGLHPRGRRWPMTLVVPIAWIGVECLRAIVAFNGYPWFLLAHPTINWPLAAQSADLMGAYFTGFLAAMWSGVLVDAARVVFDRAPRTALLWAGATVLVLWSANLAYGAWRLGQVGPLRPGPTLLGIQTNVPQSNKIAWTPEQQVHDVISFLEMTVAELEQAKLEGHAVDLIVWPETMLPGYGLDDPTLQALRESGSEYSKLALMFVDSLQRLQEALGVPMLVGSPSFEGLRFGSEQHPWDRHFNSAYLVDANVPLQRSDKAFLTPFGETMPYISNWPWLERALLDLGAEGMRFDLDAADEPRRLTLRLREAAESSSTAPFIVRPSKRASELLLATPICFEDTVSSVCRRMVYEHGVKKAQAFVNLSNDGWFGDDDAARAQHGQIARFRCIENRVPMVRVVNTGQSIAVDSRGNMVATLGGGRYGEPRRSGGLLASLQLDDRWTLFGRIGDLWAWLCLIGAASMMLFTWLGAAPATPAKESRP